MLIQNPPVEVADRLWMLGTSAYPFYLIKGRQEGAIVEGGIGALGPLMVRQLEQQGIGAGGVRQLVITHAHPDHVMAVPLLRQKFPALRVLASQAAAAALASAKVLAYFQQLDETLMSYLARSGGLDTPASPPSSAAMAVDRVVQDGDTIEVEDSSWTVLATPGHSDCSISLHNARGRVLIISDATGYYMPERGAWWPCYFSNLQASLASIERLQGLEAEVLCLGHNAVIRGAGDVHAYFDGALAATRAYHQRIIDAVRSGRTSRQAAEELGTEIHALTGNSPLEFFQKNCGLLVKQSLRYEGMA